MLIRFPQYDINFESYPTVFLYRGDSELGVRAYYYLRKRAVRQLTEIFGGHWTAFPYSHGVRQTDASDED